jgi:hemerythrin
MLEWDNKYSVKVSLIDEQHKKLFEIINKAVVVKKDSNNPRDIIKILNDMTKFAQEHFETEETYMKEFNYPEYQDHKEEHMDFSTRTIAYLKEVIKSNYRIANEILEYIKQWLVDHIQSTDKKYIDCFKRNGLK